MTRIEAAHGAGGKLMQKLIESVIIPCFTLRKVGQVGLDEMDDGATLFLSGTNLIVTSDAHTVHPLVFPGGNIGTLAACGTINDLAVMGARPVALTNTVILEEGFEIELLREFLLSMDRVLEPLGVAMIAGDTKVMPKGKIDGMVMSTTGIGLVYSGDPVTDSGARRGDNVIVTGPIGDHGTALLAHREGLKFETDIVSDVAPLWGPIRDCLDVGGIHAMKDPTRGGLAVALNEISSKSRVGIEVEEDLIPVRDSVRSLCEVLGLDPLHLSCEGTAVMAVDPSRTDSVLSALSRHAHTRESRVIGRIVEDTSGRVVMRTRIGGRKIVQVPTGEPIPRVC